MSLSPQLHVDETAARRVADAFLAGAGVAAPGVVRAAYRQLVDQTDALLHHLATRWGRRPLRIAWTRVVDPYDDDIELIAAVRATATLEVPRLDRARRHPLLGGDPGGPYDRLRALHDLVGHVLPGFGFDRDGELSAWCLQDRLHHGLARWALATELHAHHSVLWTTGELAEPKALLLEPSLLRASLPHHRAYRTL